MAVVLPHSKGLFFFDGSGPVEAAMLELMAHGTKGVQVFFAVSGFVIAYALRDVEMDGRTLGNFLLRRSIRLDPPYWAGLLLFLGYNLLRRMVAHHAEPWPSWQQGAAHLFYLQDILGLGQINIVFWTLCLEFQFYAAFALVLWAARGLSRPRRVTMSVVLYILSLLFALQPALANAWHPYIIAHWHLFAVGALTFEAIQGRLPWRIWGACLALSWLAAAVTASGGTLAGAATATLMAAAHRRVAMGQWLSGPVLQWLGRRSYSIYIVHVPVSHVILGVRTRVAPAESWSAWVFLVVLYVAALVLAALLHAAVEAPCIKLSHRFKPLRSGTVA